MTAIRACVLSFAGPGLAARTDDGGRFRCSAAARQRSASRSMPLAMSWTSLSSSSGSSGSTAAATSTYRSPSVASRYQLRARTPGSEPPLKPTEDQASSSTATPGLAPRMSRIGAPVSCSARSARATWARQTSSAVANHSSVSTAVGAVTSLTSASSGRVARSPRTARRSSASASSYAARSSSSSCHLSWNSSRVVTNGTFNAGSWWPRSACRLDRLAADAADGQSARTAAGGGQAA